jgi:hypothetical protein
MRVPRLPWPSLSSPFGLQASGLRIDGADVALKSTDRISVTDLAGVSWTELAIDLNATLPDAFAAESGVSTGDTSVVATLLDVATNTRIPLQLDGDGLVRSGTLHLHREEIAARCRIAAVATTTIAGVSDREVGRSYELILDADPPSVLEIAGRSPFAMVWTDFATPAEGAPQILTSVKDSPFWFDQSASQPVLWLNEGIPYLAKILLQERPRGRARDSQNMIGAWIASSVWSSLVERAMGDLSSGEDGEAIQVLDPLSERVLELLAPHTEGVADKAELLEQLGAARHDADLRRGLNARLQVGISRLTSTNETISRAVKDAWHD